MQHEKQRQRQRQRYNPAGGRTNPANSGRGNAGCGGTKPPPRTGTKPEIGAFLGLGREMNHGSVSAWMRKFREYTRTNYKSDISEIFRNEGIPGDYPQYVAPVDIAADANFVVSTKWKRALELYDKLVLTLREDRKQVFGLMLGRISEQSKSTIRETEAGSIAMLDKDPLLLLQAIILTTCRTRD